MIRCGWCGTDPLYVAYRDTEWGVPLHDDRKIFEYLVFEGAPAGLSWITVLRKREAYRASFDRFDPEKVARYGARKVRSLLANPGIIRNRQKVEAAIANARAFLEVCYAHMQATGDGQRPPGRLLPLPGDRLRRAR